ncbi:MAG: hypothetical protein K9L66_04155 [Spirochaetaceae bacterium]|nr:hypothetical protein [Spirochaetaceae bacterium]MCF7948398.1 hypothetical protein [Spirochaetia bacterium]MCF7950847.1 hypothetical protein [Spirochaetaceae bacterium]
MHTLKEASVEWLLQQKVPNGTVESPVPQRRNLLISYDIPPDDPAYPYLKGRAYVYDSALAAIVFAMTGHDREAEEVLLALSRQLRPEGSLWFGVNLHNEWPSEEGHTGATVRSGASAWAGYAATFYLRKKLQASAPGAPEAPGAPAAQNRQAFHTEDRIGRRILFFAEQTARHLLSLQITDRDDPRYGLITGGQGTYELKAKTDGSVSSEYSDGKIGWASTEHNIDAYFLFRDLALLTGGKRYQRAAEMITEGLLSLWDEERRQLIQGIKETGRRDTVLPLDTSSWGSIFLRQAGYPDKAEATLSAGVERFQLDRSGHFRPYAADQVFLDPQVSQSYFNNPDITWNQLDIAWPEGSLGMATALIKAGRNEKALQIIRASREYTENGAVQYASLEVPHQFSTYPSVASTAWLVIALENLLDPLNRSLFWSYE